MKFEESISHGFNNYAEFDGRQSRSSFWWWILFIVIVKAALETLSNSLQSLWTIAVFLPTLSGAVRRIHDVNKSGWLILVPVYNIYILCQKGMIGENRFGTAPLS